MNKIFQKFNQLVIPYENPKDGVLIIRESELRRCMASYMSKFGTHYIDHNYFSVVHYQGKALNMKVLAKVFSHYEQDPQTL